MNAQLIVLSSPLGYADASKFKVDAGKTIETMVIDNIAAEKYRRNKNQPIDIMLNGEIVPADEWHLQPIKEGDQLIAMPRAQDATTIIYLIVLVLAVYYVSTIDVSIPQEDQLEQSPSYEANPQGNRARIGEPIPVHYGRFRTYPDYTSYPIQETINNEKWGFYLFSIGVGSYDIEQPKFGDTLASNFEGFEFEQYEPGQRVTLVPSAAYSAPEVGGGGITLFAPNESNYTGESGPHPANAAETQANTLLFDFTLPRGLHIQNKSGGLDAKSVSVRVEWREIDDSGNPVDIFAGWDFEDYSYSDATIDALFFTESVQVPPARYEVRARRLNTSTDSHRENDELRWAGLRSYLETDQTFDETVVAVKVKVSAQLSAQAERKFNLIATRRLPIYDAANDVWQPEGSTRNPIWALCDAIKSNGYTDQNIRDLSKLAALAAFLDSRGDVFDGRFEQKVNLWDGLRRILRVCRAKPTNYGDSFDVVRDGPEQRGEYQFIGRNRVKGSFGLQFRTLDQWQDHSVIIEYTNPQTWVREPITCFLPGTTPTNPEKIGLLDTTDRQHAFREGMFAVARRYFRNRIASLTTELDGRAPELFDRGLISAVLPRWGSSGDVLGQDETNPQILVVSEPLPWQDGVSHYAWLAMDDGSNSDSFEVNRVFDSEGEVDPYRMLLTESVPNWLYYGYRKEKTRYAFGAGGDQPRRMIMTGAKPSGDARVSLTFENDDPRVHQYDELINNGSLILPPPVNASPSLDLAIRGVYVVHGGTVDIPELQFTWMPVAGAQNYFVGIRYDEASPWRRVYSGPGPQARFEVSVGDVYVRIAAMGDEVGPWYEHGVINAGGEFATPVTPSGFQLVSPFVGKTLSLEWQDDVAAARWRVDYVDTSNQVRWSQYVDEPTTSLTSEIAVANGLGRTIVCRLYAINANDVPSSVPAEITATNPQVAQLQGVISFINVNVLHINFDVPADDDFAGVIVYAGAPGFDTATAYKVVQSDGEKSSVDIVIVNPSWTAVRIAGFDVWGRDDLNISPEIQDVAAGLRESDLNQSLSETIGLINAPGTGLVDRLSDAIQQAQDGRDNLQSQIESLQVTSDVAVYRQPDEPLGNIEVNSRWFDTDDGNRPYIYVDGAWQDVSDQRILDNAAAIQNEQLVRANQFGSVSSQVSTLQVSFNDQIGSIQQAQQAIVTDVDQVKLQQYTKLDSDGYVIGYGAYNAGPGENGFIVRVDKFGIGVPSQSDSFPFVFDAQAGRLFVSSAYIPNLDVGILTGDIATFIQANFSTVQIGSGNVSGLLQSDNFSSGSETGLSLNFANGEAFFYNLTARGNITANHLNAATGTFGGTLTAQAVNAVDTINIAENAITLIEEIDDPSVVRVYTTGSSSDGITINNLYSFSVDYSDFSDGQTVMFHYFILQFRVQYGRENSFREGRAARFRIYANDVLVYTYYPSHLPGDGVEFASINLENFLHTVTSGVTTYRVAFDAMVTSGRWYFFDKGPLRIIFEGAKR